MFFLFIFFKMSLWAKTPFLFENREKEMTSSVQKKEFQNPLKVTDKNIALDIKVEAVVAFQGQKYVLLKDLKSGKIFFLSEGETEKDITLESILLKEVILYVQGNKISLKTPSARYSL